VYMWGSSNSDGVAWMSNDGQGNFTFEGTIADTLADPSILRIADINTDGIQDILLRMPSAFVGYLNDGLGAFAAAPSISVPAQYAWAVQMADLDQDADVDLVCTYSNGPLGIAWFPNDGSGVFDTAHVITDWQSSSGILQTTDVDMDGDPDVLLSESSDVVYYRNDGSGGFVAPAVTTTWINVNRAILGDYNGDGSPDLFGVVDTGGVNYRVAWSANDGNGVFSEPELLSNNEDIPSSLYAVDMNGDGRTDVLSAYGYLSQKETWWEWSDISTGATQAMPPDHSLVAGPNPFSTTTTIRSNTRITERDAIELVDVSGRTLFQWRGTGTLEFTIDRGDLAAGVYAVHILGRDRSRVAVRVVVE
jgi:hypothetical protein